MVLSWEKMGAEAEVLCQKSLELELEVQFFAKAADVLDVVQHDVVSVAPTTFDKFQPPDLVSLDLSASQLNDKPVEKNPDVPLQSDEMQFVPCIRSGSSAETGPRRYMEDEHIRIDDLSSHLGSLFQFPQPSAFYGVFDGHGGREAAAFIKKNATRLFFEDVKFPQTAVVNDIFSEELENSLRKAFQLADLALADDCSVNSSSGTTALTALIFGRLLMVANAGDCRAVLCRKGEAIDMSQDHRPNHPPEKRRILELGGFIDDGYLNGELSVSRALGDWDMKLRRGSPSPLIADPEFRRMVLTEDDEFLIMGCDGIWDVMSSQDAVSLVRCGLQRQDDPEQCARDLVRKALRRNTFDNVTVIIVCFSPLDHWEQSPPHQRALQCCKLSPEAFYSLRSLLEGGDRC